MKRKIQLDNVKRNVIGENIQMIRREKKITQEELIARLNVRGVFIDQPMLSKIENYSREIVDYEIIEIAESLGVPIEELFKGIYKSRMLIRKNIGNDK